MWVERAAEGAIVELQSELVPWTKLQKADSLPCLCTHEHQLSQRRGQIHRVQDSIREMTCFVGTMDTFLDTCSSLSSNGEWCIVNQSTVSYLVNKLNSSAGFPPCSIAFTTGGTDLREIF